MSEIYKSIITNLGLSLLANAQVTGNKVNITHMGFGDSNGAYYEPTPTATTLRNERCRVPISSYYKNPKNNSMLTIDAVLPSDTPPAFTIREIALFDNEGNMIALGKIPATDKIDPNNSAATDLYFKLNITMAHAANINITLDPLTSLATTGYVDSKVAEIVSVEVVDDLVTNDPDKALSAKQGKKLKDDLTSHLEQTAADVRDYGAIGDGVTDDSLAFINTSNKSKSIYIPKDFTFLIDNISLTNTRLYGGGTIKWKSQSPVKLLELIGTCSIEDISFDGNGLNQTENTNVAIQLNNAPHTVIKNCKFTNFRGRIIGGAINSSENVLVENCKFHNTSQVSNGNVIDVKSSNWKIQNNKFDTIGNAHCVRVGLYNNETGERVKNTLITGNSFTDTEHNAITVELHSEVVVVDNNFFNEVAQAIKAESTNGTVKTLFISNNHFKNVQRVTALNLSVPEVTFVNNVCEDMGGGVYFGRDFLCSGNKFYRCGATDRYTISDNDGSRGIIENNQLFDNVYDAIRVRSSDVINNVIVNTVNQAIRVSVGENNISGNFINFAADAIHLVTTTANAVVTNNVMKNITNRNIIFTNNENFKTCKLLNNIGFDDKKSEYGTLVGTTTSSGNININHTLGKKPTYANAIIVGDNTYTVEILSITSTSLQLRVINRLDGSNVGSSSVEISWRVDI